MIDEAHPCHPLSRFKRLLWSHAWLQYHEGRLSWTVTLCRLALKMNQFLPRSRLRWSLSTSDSWRCPSFPAAVHGINLGGLSMRYTPDQQAEAVLHDKCHKGGSRWHPRAVSGHFSIVRPNLLPCRRGTPVTQLWVIQARLAWGGVWGIGNSVCGRHGLECGGGWIR